MDSKNTNWSTVPAGASDVVLKAVPERRADRLVHQASAAGNRGSA
jgi:hypothetical protein